jgi:hypothetical protein
MEEFFSFRKMITPSIIRIIFWIGSIATIITGLVMLLSNLGRYASGVSAIGGLFIIVLGPIAVRVVCEQVILFFRINETLSEIRNDLEQMKTTLNKAE